MALSQQDFEKLKNRLGSSPVQSIDDNFNLKDVSVGFGKGALRSAIGTAQSVQGLGQRILAGVDPTQNLDQVRQNTGFDSVNKYKKVGQEVDDTIQSKNSNERLGGAIELAAEFIIPSKLVGGTLTKAASKLLPTSLKEGVPSISKFIPENSGGVLNTVRDAVTPFEKGVESVLNPTVIIPKESLKNIPVENIVAQSVDKGKKLELYLKQAQKAVNDFSQPTPLEIAGKRAEQALNVLNNKLTKQGTLKQEALDLVGNKTIPSMGTYRNTLKDLLRERVGINYDTVEKQIVPATGRASKIALDPADNSMVGKIIERFDSLGNNPTAKEVDDVVDSIQDILYKRQKNLAVPVNSKVESILKQVTGELNGALKRVAGEQYSKANSKYSYFVDYRDKLNKSLGLEGNKGGSLMKRVFSPTDGGTKELFNKIKDLTGIDLIEDATLAKFVMENVGDARQANLLEEIINTRSVSPSSFVGRATDKILGNLQDPVGKARRIIKKNTID